MNNSPVNKVRGRILSNYDREADVLVENLQTESDMQENHDKVQSDIQALPPESRQRVLDMKSQVDAEFNEIVGDVFDFEAEDRLRAAGYSPQQAEDLARASKLFGVGKIFEFNIRGENRILVQTPFKTVVPAQNYVDALQTRLLELTTVEVEVEVSNLKQEISAFTELKFLGLITLAFKRLFKRV